jgi:hypothetical protein
MEFSYTSLYRGLVLTISLFLFKSGMLYADDAVAIFNHTEQSLFAAYYYAKSNLVGVSTGPAERCGEAVEVRPYSEGVLMRPPWKYWTDNREIIFSTNPEDLKEILNKKEYKVSSHKPAGRKYGSIYHFVEEYGIVSLYGDLDYKLLQPAMMVAKEVVTRAFHQTTDYFKQHPYAKKQALVRQSFELCPEESASVEKRLKKAKHVFENLLPVQPLPDKAVPRLGICTSGGGVRAATCADGFFAGLDDIGLLDAVIWAVGLSGSTWMLSSYYEIGKPLEEFRTYFLKAVTEEHLLASPAITDTFLQKFVYGQSLNIVDLYGVYLANKFFRNLPTDLARQRVWFSDLRDRMSDGSFMYPICTAVEITKSTHHPVWFTFSPHEVGSDELGLYIPTWALGRKFVDGVSTDIHNPPELRLGFLMGIWGSALSSTFKHMYELGVQESISNPITRASLKNVLKQTVGPWQFAPINILNPFYGLEKGGYKALDQLTLVDAGVACNVPFPPLLNEKRAVDIIIALDASGNAIPSRAEALHLAEEYAREKGHPFPKIDYTGITKKAVSVFADSDPATPIVIYVLPIKNEKHPELGDPEKEFQTTYQTSYFRYSKKDAERLIDLVRSHVVENKEVIFEAIKQKINQKMPAQGSGRRADGPLF